MIDVGVEMNQWINVLVAKLDDPSSVSTWRKERTLAGCPLTST